MNTSLSNDERARLQGLRVLYVEDDPDVAETGRDLLRDMGVEVELFVKYEPARAHIEASGGAGIDVFLSDLALDDGHIGPELLMLLRESQHGGQVPAVLLTAFGSEDDHIASGAVGYARHLVKPVTADALAQALAQVASPLRDQDLPAAAASGATGSAASGALSGTVTGPRPEKRSSAR